MASDFGKAVGWSSDLALLYLPLPAVIFIAAFMGLLGYEIQWLIIRSVISLPYIALWFPLYSVLHPLSSAVMSEDDHVKSLVEFVETSNVGEFRRRLQLLLAFYGHVTAGLRLKSYTSPFQLENQKILFNLFGCYIQLLTVGNPPATCYADPSTEICGKWNKNSISFAYAAQDARCSECCMWATTLQ